MPPDFQEARAAVIEETPILVRPLNNDFVAGYTVLEDVSGNPMLIARVDIPRDVMAEGKQSMSYLLLSLMALGLVIVVVILALLDRLVLSPGPPQQRHQRHSDGQRPLTARFGDRKRRAVQSCRSGQRDAGWT